MMPPPASVIVVSRHRPTALLRCLAALCQQDHPGFEVIVVTDPAAAQQADHWASQRGIDLRLVIFDEANISVARNLGLTQALFGVVAFIDDDAVAEPTWLSRLTAPFALTAVVAATGFVRGRNGLSFQWRACEVDTLGQDHPIEVQKITVLQGSSSRAVKTQGTNCAFRSDALRRIGGFDPALRFFLDEADVNLRLAAFGQTAIVPDAEVHHGYQASARRRADRVPLSLFEIAASTAVFLRRHAPEADLTAAWLRLADHQTQRLTAHRSAGRLSAPQMAGLLQTLADGWADGLSRGLADLAPLAPPPPDLVAQPLDRTGPRPGVVLAGRTWQKRKLLAAAEQAAGQGKIVTVLCLSPTARAHRVEFLPSGIWLQTGGLFGRSLRADPRFRLNRFARRVAVETARIAATRPVQ